ncbi:bacterial leucyl aminopeptidase precursor [bacterium BMS3Abin05]|nr:bacterial leucyl aminopeptidase precursor [bacterium BMS3Abin05]GBE26310.1 bacterial leucyl aminopeptidase precursor [bacterium BMS3Bbin03]
MSIFLFQEDKEILLRRPKFYMPALLFLAAVLLDAAGCSAQTVPDFNGKQAFRYLVKQCDFGPRNPGSAGHKKAQAYFVKEFSKFTDRVRLQPFPFVNYKDNLRLTLHNVIASFGSQSDRILLAAHWDTRPWADQDPNPKNRNTPILGADDGASGVAVLLEIARNLKENPPPVGVDLILWDGEDSGREGHATEYLQGSRYFAQHKSPSYNPKFSILLDMVGDKELQLYEEGNSYRYAPDVVDLVWGIAGDLNFTQFIPEVKYTIVDDHLPLLEVGIPSIDVIDFDYPYWHTLQDTPDKCSSESLRVVGQVLLNVIYGKTAP